MAKAVILQWKNMALIKICRKVFACKKTWFNQAFYSDGLPDFFKVLFVFIPFIFLGCQSANTKEKDTLLTSLSSAHTGIKFENELTHDKEFNIYTYRNFYNGGT